jgi:hypothetical protein
MDSALRLRVDRSRQCLVIDDVLPSGGGEFILHPDLAAVQRTFVVARAVGDECAADVAI